MLNFYLAEKLNLVEQTVYIREVVGSNPISATLLTVLSLEFLVQSKKKHKILNSKH